MGSIPFCERSRKTAQDQNAKSLAAFCGINYGGLLTHTCVNIFYKYIHMSICMYNLLLSHRVADRSWSWNADRASSGRNIVKSVVVSKVDACAHVFMNGNPCGRYWSSTHITKKPDADVSHKMFASNYVKSVARTRAMRRRCRLRCLFNGLCTRYDDALLHSIMCLSEMH